ncbi:MAG: prepilin peptidase [Candidatus Korobacteraceae bacterium]
MWNAFILAFVVTAAVSDVCSRRIPRVLTLAGLGAGLAFHGLQGQFVSALTASGVGFCIGLALFHIRALGGGDVKLMAALGALLGGLQPWVTAMAASCIVAGLISGIAVVQRNLVRQTLENLGRIFGNLFRNGWSAHPEIHVDNPALVRSPFAPAAALGTLASLIRL